MAILFTHQPRHIDALSHHQVDMVSLEPFKIHFPNRNLDFVPEFMAIHFPDDFYSIEPCDDDDLFDDDLPF